MYKKYTSSCESRFSIPIKLLLMMKLSFVLLITVFLQTASAVSYGQNVSIVKHNVSLQQILRELESQTPYNFIYNAKMLEQARPVTLNLRNAPLSEALEKCFKDQPFSYKVTGNTIVIMSKAKETVEKQNILIKGKVNDKEGLPLPGVSVKLKTDNKIAITNANGEYAINVPNQNAVLVFSLLGFQTTELSVGNQTQIDIVLQEQLKALNEVVVTALGIRREEKALGYAITKIDGTQLTDAPSGNWTDALSGKVPGLNMVRSNGGPTGSNKIILRGENNLTGENEALIVVDGVVINSGSGRRTATGGDAAGPSDGMQPTDFGSGLNDLNPQDIESVTVLRGPGASALYGQRGANGAIIITTKSGSIKSKSLVPSITFSSNLAFESANRWPDLQYEYGQGLNGASTYAYGTNSGTSLSWGPRFNGQMYFQYDPNTQAAAAEATPWVPYRNQIRDFFETGRTLTNSLSLSGNIKNTNYRLSGTHANNTWIIPNTGYERTNLSLSSNTKVTSKLNVAVKANYTNKASDNLPWMGYGNQSVM